MTGDQIYDLLNGVLAVVLTLGIFGAFIFMIWLMSKD